MFLTIPGSGPGSAVTADFCFGPPSGSAIEAAVVDPTAQSAGANSFIEGSGNSFTVYTAFKSVQAGPNGDTCEVHEVEIFSGIRNIDGSLSSLSIGFGIVGLVGDCGGLLVGDFQVSQNATGVPGISWVGGSTPADPAKVLVSVENFLLTDVAVYVTFGSSTTFM